MWVPVGLRGAVGPMGAAGAQRALFEVSRRGQRARQARRLHPSKRQLGSAVEPRAGPEGRGGITPDDGHAAGRDILLLGALIGAGRAFESESLVRL